MAIGIRYDETFFSSRALIMPIHPLINVVPKASIHRNFRPVFHLRWQPSFHPIPASINLLCTTYLFLSSFFPFLRPFTLRVNHMFDHQLLSPLYPNLDSHQHIPHFTKQHHLLFAINNERDQPPPPPPPHTSSMQHHPQDNIIFCLQSTTNVISPPTPPQPPHTSSMEHHLQNNIIFC